MTAPGPEPRRCLNCGGALTGPWCAQCGQQDTAHDPSLREFAHEATKELVEWDGRLLQSLRALVLEPGRLTEEFVAGRRMRWVPPMRLYLMTSVFYFLLAAGLDSLTHRSENDVVRLTLPDTAVMTNGKGQRTLRPEIAREIDSSGVTRIMGSQTLKHALEDPKAFTTALNQAFPKAIFCLVPIFAFLVFGVYRRQMPRYVPHLFFAFHLHAFGFVLWTVRALLGALSANLAWRGGISLAAQVVLLIYALLALRRVYGGGWGGTLGRAVIITIGYGFCFLIGITLMAVITLISF